MRTSSIAHDVRYALRSISQSPHVSLGVVMALALGIGATTAALSIVDGIFFRPFPGIGHANELVALYTDNKKTPAIEYGSFSYLDYSQHYRNAGVFSDLAAYARFPMVVSFDEATERVNGDTVSGNYFTVLETRPLIGRVLSEEDDSAASTTAAVISYRLWVSSFSKSPDVLGKTIRINGNPVVIVGVAPEGFVGTVIDWGGPPDIWVAIAKQPELFQIGADLLKAPVPWHLAVGRLRSGVGIEQAQAALQIITSGLAPAAGQTNRSTETAVIVMRVNEARFFPGFRSRLATFTGSLAAISGLILLIAVFNVANLLLARLLSRNKEFAVKLALGAKPRQLARQVIVENSIVILAAGAVGLWIASWTATLLAKFPQPFRVSMEIPLQLDGRFAALALLATIILGAALSLVSVVHLSRRRLYSALKSDLGLPRVRIARINVLRVCLLLQIAVGTMLAATAGLSIRSIRNSVALDPEFRPEGMFVSSLDLLPLPPQRRGNFLTQLQDALGTMPAVATASLAGEPPLGGTRRMRRVRQVGEQTTIDAALSYVTPGYFQTIGATILEGQELIPRQDTARAVIINDVIAARYWPGQTAVGRYLHIDGEQIDREVRAVIRTSKCIDITDEDQTCLYLPLAQTAPQAAVLFRPKSDSASAVSAIRTEIRRLDPTVAVYNTKSLSEHLNNRFSGQNLLASLATVLALVGLVILVLGVFALVSFTIAQTTRSIGIRLAVGATASRIVRELLMQLAVIAGIGIVAGIAGVMALGPLIRNQLFQTSPHDPIALGGAAILLIVASLGACAIAARRVAGIDPATTLRRL